MLMVYMLWIVLVFGGLFLGLGALWTVYRQGFDPVLLASAVLYLGCASYALPKLWKLVAGRS